MKVEVKSQSGLAELPYPKLMQSKNNSQCIVFFIKRGVGVVVSPYEDKPIGHYRTDWYESGFLDFQGTITITQ